MRRALILIALATPATLPAQPARQGGIHAFLQREFAGERGTEARYSLAWADLDGDRRPEAIVYLQSRGYCGTGGCTLFVYRAHGRSWRQVARRPTNHLPIRVLNTRSHGWRDLASRGRMLRNDRFVRYEERLVFDGRTYPVEGAIDMMRAPPGRVLIAENDRGRRLF